MQPKYSLCSQCDTLVHFVNPNKSSFQHFNINHSLSMALKQPIHAKKRKTRSSDKIKINDDEEKKK